MKLVAEWLLLLSKPSAARTATIALGVMWAIAAIWGWFFVEPTVLRDSQAARNFVDFATSIFPWLKNVRELGAQADKALYLHSVFTFLTILPGLVYGVTWERNPLQIAKIASLSTTGRFWHLVGYPVGIVLLLLLYVQLKPSFGAIHRMDYLFFVGEVTMPVISPLLTGGIWAGVGGFLGVMSVQFREINRT